MRSLNESRRWRTETGGGPRSRIGVFTALGLGLVAAPAWAQQPVSPPGEDSGVIQWVIAVAALALVCGAAFMNPKRSHLT